MDFTLSDEQAMFAGTARALFGDMCGPDQWRAMMHDQVAFDATRWAAIAENGLSALLLPESAGGLGLTEIDFALIAIEAGYAALPEPLVESAGVAMPMLASLAADHALLADPASIVAIAPAINPAVASADGAQAILVEREGRALLVMRADARLTPVPTIDPLRRLFTIAFDTAQDLGPADWDLALDRAALFAAAQGMGLAQRCVDLAVAYAKDRTQFGKPIGSYQAVKHHLASAQVAIEFARPVVLAAAAVCPARDIYARARISEAKLVALAAADQAARAAIQVHGAMGYSWEVDVHLFLKRALALTQSWGTPHFHRARVAARVFNRPLGPDTTFARESNHA
ncbi:acyl-CoA dehydrogenase family protein [Novosphingobium sp.]|uniref:acyl-CoA dehydrogenase family protein n=1 Tax=Novosphingobium sp. TaxID=1874826 RepID=UPI003B52322B